MLPFLIVFLAALVRILFVVGVGSDNRRYDALYDDEMYINLATQLASGHGYSLTRDYFTASANTPTAITLPMYPALLAGVFLTLGQNYLAVRIIQAILGAVTVACIYWIARRILDRRNGLFAATIAAVYPLFVMYTRPLLTETLFCCLLALSTSLALQARDKPTTWRIVGCGLALGAGLLTRGEMAVYGAILVAIASYTWWRHRGLRFTMRATALLVTISLAILLPWVVRSSVAQHTLVLFENKQWSIWETNWLRWERDNGAAIANASLPERIILPNWDALSETERDRALGSIGVEFIRSHPAIYARYSLTRLLYAYPVLPRELFSSVARDDVQQRAADLSPDALDEFPSYTTAPEKIRAWAFRILFGLGLVGVGWAWRRKTLTAVAPLLLLIGANMAVAALLHGKERLRLTVDPYLIVVGCWGLVVVIGWWHDVVSNKIAGVRRQEPRGWRLAGFRR